MSEPPITGERVVVVGSGMTGIECAEMLADNGNFVELYEMVEQIGPGIFFQNLIDIMGRLVPTGTKMFPGHKLVDVKGNIATFDRFGQAIDECWRGHDTLLGFAMDHGCHEIDDGCGSHGLDMPEDLNILHLYGVKPAR